MPARRSSHFSVAGRSEEFALLRAALDRGAAGTGGALFFDAPAGTGKSHLVRALREEAAGRGFLAVAGSAYPLESTVPYALFADLLEPLVRGISRDALLALTRGGAEFQLLAPTLVHGAGDEGDLEVDVIPDLRNRLLWGFPDFLQRLRGARPLLLILEDLEWADPSSLELLHFLARQSIRHPFLIVGTFDGKGGGAARIVADAVNGLVDRGEARRLRLDNLDSEGVVELVSSRFRVVPEVIRPLARRLFRWTGGNPLYLVSTLDSLIDSGHIRQEGGRWTGWEVEDLPAPGTVRDLVLNRLASLSPRGKEIAELAAISGSRTLVTLLAQAAKRTEEEADAAMAELVQGEILVEESSDEGIVARFRHPIVREILLREIGLARTRRLHLSMLRALEARMGERVFGRAAEIAVHVLGAGSEADPGRGTLYLAAAGRQALASGAFREARVMLEEALRRLEGADLEPEPGERARLLEDLARAHQRLGRHDRAIPLLLEAREGAEKVGTPAEIAALDRRLALSAFWGGRVEDAFTYCNRGIALAVGSGDPILESRLRLVASACLRDLARGEEAQREGERALRLAADGGNPEVEVAAHRTLLFLHTWGGPPTSARRHAEAVIRRAEMLGDREAVAQAHWATAVMEGLTGNHDAMRDHLERAERLSEELHSPLLHLQIAALWIELSVSLGEWDRGADLAAEAIRSAREMNQPILLPQLLLLSGLIHLGRGEMALAEREIDEAWKIAGSDGERTGPGAPHLGILAHAGKAALYLAAGRHAEALQMGDAGMALVDATGYRAWAIHRLLPTMVEAALHLRELDRAEAIGRRLREEAEHFGHTVGHIWADTCEGLVAWLRGDIAEGARRMAAAADRLEAVQVLPDAARLRRQLAGRLAELGDRDAAIRELRRVHDALATLGAAPELEKVRGQFREVGARPPTRTGAPGAGTLTPREAEIARLIAARQSNKAIAKELGISPRTVGTHLTTVFRKLAIGTRGELVDLVRDGILESGTSP